MKRHYFPAEWHPHTRTWMGFPGRDDRWQDRLPEVKREIASVANAIARFEPVLLFSSRNTLEEARSLCDRGVEIVERDIDDLWLRDSGPTFVQGESGEVTGVSWRFNAWGEKHEQFEADARLAETALATFGISHVKAPFVTEGGNFDSDGEGTLLVSESALFHDNRNPGLTRADASRFFHEVLGADKVIWLPGVPSERVTDGHLDGFARFVRPGVVLAEITDDKDHPEHEELEACRRRLIESTDAKGRPLEVITLKRPQGSFPDDFCTSYINFYVFNGGVLLPKYGDEDYDELARATLARAFPTREVISLSINTISSGGGGLHCITQQHV